MPGLIRGVARTAAVVGTANAVSHRQNQRYAAKDQQAAQAAAYQQQQYAQPQQQYAPPPQQYAPPAPVVEEDPTVAKINQLAALHAQGVLSDEEFSAAKARALGISATGKPGQSLRTGWRSPSWGATRFHPALGASSVAGSISPGSARIT
jgi:hypothetical protein